MLWTYCKIHADFSLRPSMHEAFDGGVHLAVAHPIVSASVCLTDWLAG